MLFTIYHICFFFQYLILDQSNKFKPIQIHDVACKATKTRLQLFWYIYWYLLYYGSIFFLATLTIWSNPTSNDLYAKSWVWCLFQSGLLEIQRFQNSNNLTGIKTGPLEFNVTLNEEIREFLPTATRYAIMFTLDFLHDFDSGCNFCKSNALKILKIWLELKALQPDQKIYILCFCHLQQYKLQWGVDELLCMSFLINLIFANS